jgi:hypothetical protein
MARDRTEARELEALNQSITRHGYNSNLVFPDQEIKFTERELVALSDVLRRVRPGSFFHRPEFDSAMRKISEAKANAWLDNLPAHA